MSSLGRSISKIRQFNKIKEISNEIVEKPIGIKTPLSKGKKENETLFEMNFNPNDQIRDNLKNLILTQKGERLGFPDFGTNLSILYSDTNLTLTQIEEILMKEISDVVQKYLGSVTLEEFYTGKVENDQNDTVNIANNLLSTQSSLLIDNVRSGKKINNSIASSESIYEINIKYNIPLLNSNNELLTIYIKAVR